MRIVFDTNVLLAGVFTRGLCEALLDECIENPAHVLLSSDHILGEFVRQARTKFGAPVAAVRQTETMLRDLMTLVRPAEVPPDACRDGDDLPVLGTALAAGADCLVSGDADILSLGSFEGILILSPRALLERLRNAPESPG